MKKTISTILVTVVLSACSAPKSAENKLNTMEEKQMSIKQEVAKGALMVDVRTPEEFASGHIDGAINIPYDQIEAKRSALDKVKKDENILVYCRSGRRSEIARQSLNKLGFKNVQNGGGIDGLIAKIRYCKGATTC